MTMQNSTLRALFIFVAAMVVCVGSAAEAGTVLLARESTIRATGTAGSGGYNLSDGSEDFSGFSDAVDTVDAGLAGARVAANQHSRPSVTNGGFLGAFAEGSASTDAGSGTDPAEAVSDFGLTFQVLDAPSLMKLGGSVGVSGNGSTSVCLTNESTGDVVLQQELFAGNGEGQSIEQSTMLQPGVYELSVAAMVNGEPTESMAYYTFSLSLASGDGGVTPIPLPPMVWAAAALLGTGAGVQGLRRMRRVVR